MYLFGKYNIGTTVSTVILSKLITLPLRTARKCSSFVAIAKMCPDFCKNEVRFFFRVTSGAQMLSNAIQSVFFSHPAAMARLAEEQSNEANSMLRTNSNVSLVAWKLFPCKQRSDTFHFD